ncbi:hypothetical protein SAMN05421504_102588 [Amycolatopsis xylanica]|uniref:Uncharacterized protein n=1 Tax=Amycolatopsis xylanica TaxID=589385 RepID=A0A1H2ZMA0_9PSEU|nr:hypothetical protein [Amycolatopsis xylanica]SDX18580.1 hypothetical protein SAMN05421504_102588 [Amycolatopsis xylanica]
MNDLEALRTALNEAPPEGLALDTAAVLTSGKRLRRRRQLLHGTGVVGVAAAVAAVVLGSGMLRAVPPPGNAPIAAPSTSLSIAPQGREPYGDVIPTGLKVAGGELVYYAVRVDEPQALPDTHFGVMTGIRSADGKLKDLMIVNGTSGSDRKPGFRELDGGEQVNGQFVPVFGYFVGPVAKIVTTAHGKEVQASLAKWSVDPTVTVFWFDPQLVDSYNVLSPPYAYDAAGNKLSS